MLDPNENNINKLEECDYIPPDMARLFALAENDNPNQKGVYQADGHSINALGTNLTYTTE